MNEMIKMTIFRSVINSFYLNVCQQVDSVCASRSNLGSRSGSVVQSRALRSQHSPENAARERSRVRSLRQAFHSLQVRQTDPGSRAGAALCAQTGTCWCFILNLQLFCSLSAGSSAFSPTRHQTLQAGCSCSCYQLHSPPDRDPGSGRDPSRTQPAL